MDIGSSVSLSGSPKWDIPIPSFEDYNTEIWGHDFIQEHARQNRDGLEAMFASNEFIEVVRTIEQWDATKNYDAPLVNVLTSTNAVVPSELYNSKFFIRRKTYRPQLTGGR